MAITAIWDNDVREDMNRIGWNPFNFDESLVLKSSKVSFYKGVPVYRVSGNRSGTFLAMFLTHETNDRLYPTNIVKHEWGHAVQQLYMGPVGYLMYVGLPSYKKLGRWAHTGDEFDYYNAPWETMADIFGGVGGWKDRKHTDEEKRLAIGHLYVAMFYGPYSFMFIHF